MICRRMALRSSNIVKANAAVPALSGHANGTTMLLRRTSNKKGAGEKPSANKPAMQD